MTIQGSKKVLVVGLSGPMAKAIVPELQAEGHEVRVIAYVPERAKDFKANNVEVIQGTVGNREDLMKALDGVSGVCIMGMPHEEDPAKEAEYGKAVIDACLTKGVKHVVHVSVCCSDKNTGVYHFDSKHQVEEYLKKSGLSYTILRPAWFMENFLSNRYLPSIKEGVLSMPLRPERTLELVSASDVARVAAEAFTVPDKLTERDIDLAADRLTMEEIAEEISRVMPKSVVYRQISDADAGREMSLDMRTMFKWLDEHGYTGDLLLAENLLKRFEIKLTGLRAFLYQYKEEFRKAA